MNLKSTSTKLNSLIPTQVLKAAQKLTSENYKTYLAGGCVRDLILKRKPKDWDIVTNASLDHIQKIFPESLDVGVAFGIVKLKTKPENPSVDIAIFRKETTYTDSRHPDQIFIGDELTDTSRRDFTINALYYNPNTEEILDYVDGLKDIESRSIKAVGEPKARFNEDALRLLRALRFYSQLGFKIESKTMTAIKSCVKNIENISRERVREETMKLLEGSHVVGALDFMTKTGLWEQVFGNKKSSIPADFRSIRFQDHPSALDWIVGLSVSGMFGDPLKNGSEIEDRLVNLLRLTNAEKKIIHCTLKIYDYEKTLLLSPLEWIEIARAHPTQIEIAKRFIRRARGVTEEHKDQCMQFIDKLIRWSKPNDFAKHFPTAESLPKLKGKALGDELKKKQWEVFNRSVARAI